MCGGWCGTDVPSRSKPAEGGAVSENSGKGSTGVASGLDGDDKLESRLESTSKAPLSESVTDNAFCHMIDDISSSKFLNPEVAAVMVGSKLILQLYGGGFTEASLVERELEGLAAPVSRFMDPSCTCWVSRTRLGFPTRCDGLYLHTTPWFRQRLHAGVSFVHFTFDR